MKKLLLVLIIMGIAFPLIAMADEDVLRPNGVKVFSEGGSYEAAGERLPITIGVEGGINYNMFNQSLSWSTPVPQSVYNTYSTGDGFSVFFGAFVDVPLSKKIGLQFKLSYDKKAFSNEYTCIMDGTNTFTGLREDVSVVNKYETDFSYVGFTLSLRYDITNELVCYIGPTLLVPSADYIQTSTATVLTKDFYWDIPTQQTVRIQKDTAKNESTRFGLEFGLGYKIKLSPKISLVPQGRYQFMPAKFAEDQSGFDRTRILYGTPALELKDKKLNSLQIALALCFNL